MINMKNSDSNKIDKKKINKKSYKSAFIYYIGYVTVKGLRYVKINSANPLYPIINKINGYSKEDNRNKYLTLVHIDRSKNTVKKYEELWNKIRDLTRPKSNNSDDYDEKYKKIKHN